MDNTIINEIKSLAMDMISNASSGHPGIALSAAPIIYSLYSNHLKFNPLDPNWPNRDRFILSAGHGSALLYATLYVMGYDIGIEDLKEFRRINSITPGHPEYGVTPGVEATTGPLGQGFANAVGIALGERFLNNVITKNGGSNLLIDYYTYVLCSDGDLMEGISYEAASFAGVQKLGKLIVLYDSNDVSLDGDLNKTFVENVCDRFNSMGWQTIKVDNGKNIDAISEAISEAKKNTEQPTLIEIKTVIGDGSLLEGKSAVHGKPLNKDDIIQLKAKLRMSLTPFNIDENIIYSFRDTIKPRIQSEYLLWSNLLMRETENDKILNIMRYINKSEFESIDFTDLPKLNNIDELRNYNNYIMNYIAQKTNLFIGGSADLSSSCKTYLKDFQDISFENPGAKNIWFGVREHAMGAIINGLSLTGIRSYGSTFLSFLDYQKAPLRLSTIMNINPIYIYTHDSILIGEDGPTHQPIEQLGCLRSIINLDVYRPCDYNELIGTWQNILISKKPTCIVINKNKTPLDMPSDSSKVSLGGYIISKEKNRLDAVIIATGSEVEMALNIQTHLYNFGYDVRIVSMPCLEKFLNTDRLYQNQVIPVIAKIFVLESSNDVHMMRFVNNPNHFININNYGKSGKKEDVEKYLNYDFETIFSTIEKFLS